MKKLRVLYKRPNEPLHARMINDTLGALQGLVEGYIEVVRAFGNGVIILGNEEAAINGMAYNCMDLYGPIVFVGTDGEDFRSLTDLEIMAVTGNPFLKV